MKQALGNTAFSAGNYADAVKHFTDAIGVDAANHVFYSNRSAAYAALNDYDAALTDAEKTVAIKPDWVKGVLAQGRRALRPQALRRRVRRIQQRARDRRNKRRV